MPPDDDQQSAPSGMHGLSSVKGKRGTSSVIQWLREGTHPLNSKYIKLSDTDNYEFYLYSPTGKTLLANLRGAILNIVVKKRDIIMDT